MLINCSNHPSRFWGTSQKEAAKVYGETVDLPFPKVEPWFDTEDLRALVREYAEKIESLEADAVLLAGEFTFMFMLVDKLLTEWIRTWFLKKRFLLSRSMPKDAICRRS